MFNKYRAGWTPDVMSTVDQNKYDALPPVVTIYRGQNKSSRRGLAWSLSRDKPLRLPSDIAAFSTRSQS